MSRDVEIHDGFKIGRHLQNFGPFYFEGIKHELFGYAIWLDIHPKTPVGFNNSVDIIYTQLPLPRKHTGNPEKVFDPRLKGDFHNFWKDNAWCLDKNILVGLIKYKPTKYVRQFVWYDDEKIEMAIYATLEDFVRYGKDIDEGHGVQRELKVKYWIPHATWIETWKGDL